MGNEYRTIIVDPNEVTPRDESIQKIKDMGYEIDDPDIKLLRNGDVLAKLSFPEVIEINYDSYDPYVVSLQIDCREKMKKQGFEIRHDIRSIRIQLESLESQCRKNLERL